MQRGVGRFLVFTRKSCGTRVLTRLSRQNSPSDFLLSSETRRGLQYRRAGDDNRHYQTTELLINELVRHNKQFEMFAYPNRTHAIKEGKNTTRHLREMMMRYLLGHLPPGPR